VVGGVFAPQAALLQNPGSVDRSDLLLVKVSGGLRGWMPDGRALKLNP